MHVLVKNVFTKFSDFRAVGSYTTLLRVSAIDKAEDDTCPF